ncbi:MAG: S-layer homology domain-containing protein [Clostridiales bacterium]|jgi:hypothetical protein|nr:S-layer homology domain-containing protein [Clostridiales bacterium]
MFKKAAAIYAAVMSGVIIAATALITGAEPVLAANMNITAGSVNGNVGDIVTVPVNVSGNAGLAGMSLKMDFDGTYLFPVSVTPGEALGEGFFIDNLSYAESPVKTVNVTWVGVKDFEGDGELFTVRFKIVEKLPGEVSLGLTAREGSIINESNSPITPVLESGAVVSGSQDNTGNGNNGENNTENNAENNAGNEGRGDDNRYRSDNTVGGSREYDSGDVKIPPSRAVYAAAADENFSEAETAAEIPYPEEYVPADEVSPEEIDGTTVLLTDYLLNTPDGESMAIPAPGLRIVFSAEAVASLKRQISADLALKAVLTRGIEKPEIALALTGRKNSADIKGNVTVCFDYAPYADENPVALAVSRLSPKHGIIPRSHYLAGEMRFTLPVTALTAEDSVFAALHNPKRFADVKDADWYAGDVLFVAARDIASGVAPNTFDPESKITRAQALMMLMNAYGISPVPGLKGNFDDAGDTYYTAHLQTALALGLIHGIGENRFAPDIPVTRQELFTMLYSVLKLLNEEPKGSETAVFGETPAAWAEEAVNALISSGTIRGDNGALYLSRTASRAEMAATLHRLIIE